MSLLLVVWQANPCTGARTTQALLLAKVWPPLPPLPWMQGSEPTILGGRTRALLDQSRVSVRLLVGDCRETLRTLEAGSVQTVCTSPPYYGLRDYGLPPLVWGGSPEHAHAFESVHRLQRSGVNHDGGAGYRDREDRRYIVASGLCACGAWLGSLGLEPTPELWIEHLIEVFREVRRVLRDDGTVWCNLGDSYSGSGNGSNDHRQNGASFSKNDSKYQGQKPGTQTGYKAKDLMLLPARLALALQADGWWIRSQIPWLKRNSMPESVVDRPASSVEYVYLLSKSARYMYDADAVRSKSIRGGEIPGGNYKNGADAGVSAGWAGGQVPANRNRRNSDWFMESWQGLLADEDDEPLALVVNPTGYKGSHFATFPPKLVEPMIKASTSERGQCPTCGAPWLRITETTQIVKARNVAPAKYAGGADGERAGTWTASMPAQTRRHDETLGWRPSCVHLDLDPVPQTILDPFGGSGCTGLVADRLGRNAILCELNPSYGDQAVQRITDDAPLFTEMLHEPLR